MIHDSLQQLFNDYLTRVTTKTDKQRLLSYLNDPQLEGEVKKILLQDLESERFNSEDHEEIRNRLHQRLGSLIDQPVPVIPHYRKKSFNRKK